MLNTVVLEQIKRFGLPKIMTRSQLLDNYIRNYDGNDVMCKEVIAAAKRIGIKVIDKKMPFPAATQADVKKSQKPLMSLKNKPVQRKYIDDPVKLIELKTKCTYKEIAKIYNVNPNRIYEDIKHYKRNVLA